MLEQVEAEHQTLCRAMEAHVLDPTVREEWLC
jgi:hypothetical protein